MAFSGKIAIDDAPEAGAVLKDGKHVAAANVRGGVPDPVVGGVTFQQLSVTKPAGSGGVTIRLVDIGGAVRYNSAEAVAARFSGRADLETMLGVGYKSAYDKNGLRLEIRGLTPGTAYQLQGFFWDAGPNTSFFLRDGEHPENRGRTLRSTDPAKGYYWTARWTADASTKILELIPAGGNRATLAGLSLRSGPGPDLRAFETSFRQGACSEGRAAMCCIEVTPDMRERLVAAIANHPWEYDPERGLLVGANRWTGPATDMPGGAQVHFTRWSVEYALALFDSRLPEHIARGHRIIETALPYQDTDPESPTFGLWPYFAEEPLDEMPKPDFNWADFIGIALLDLRHAHEARIEPDSLERIDAAIRRAAELVADRDVSPSYTNVAAMSAYFLLAAGELADDGRLLKKGRHKIRALHAYRREHGGFGEYNSPNYSIVTLDALRRIICHVNDREAVALAEDLYDYAWSELATFYHPPTHQLAGPHSRSSTFLNERRREVFALATGIRKHPSRYPTEHNVHEIKFIRRNHRCPEPYREKFKSLDAPREISRVLLRTRYPIIAGLEDRPVPDGIASELPRDQYAIRASSYLHPRFALGTANRSVLGHQRRPFIAHFGTSEDPLALTVHGMKDGKVFHAAQFFSLHEKGSALGAITFATNGGDEHIHLDRLEDGRFRAERLAIRFEVTAMRRGSENLRRVAESLEHDATSATFGLGELKVRLEKLVDVFGDGNTRMRVNRNGRKLIVDFEIYDGEERAFDLTAMDRAAFAFGAHFSTGDEASLEARAHVDDQGRLQGTLGRMTLETPVEPDVGQLLRGKTVFGERAGSDENRPERDDRADSEM